jgi:hypothetical protein
MEFPTFNLRTQAPLAVSCPRELRHQHGLFELEDGAENLTD